ncbi:MAG: hypothetical protein AB8E15_07215 [Bdellovibrionales bacterium]
MDEKSKIAVFGGTGLIGYGVLQGLAEDAKASIVSFQRASTGKQPLAYDVSVLSNFTPETIENLPGSFSTVICCLGTTIKKAGSKEKFRYVDFDLSLATAKLAQKNNAKYILVSATGADPNSKVFYNRVKGDLEKAVQEMDMTSVTIFQPSLLIGNREEFRLLENIGENAYRFFKLFLPKKTLRAVGTETENLISHILKEVASKDSGLVRLSPKEIVNQTF